MGSDPAQSSPILPMLKKRARARKVLRNKEVIDVLRGGN